MFEIYESWRMLEIYQSHLNFTFFIMGINFTLLMQARQRRNEAAAVALFLKLQFTITAAMFLHFCIYWDEQDNKKELDVETKSSYNISQ